MDKLMADSMAQRKAVKWVEMVETKVRRKVDLLDKWLVLCWVNAMVSPMAQEMGPLMAV